MSYNQFYGQLGTFRMDKGIPCRDYVAAPSELLM